MCTVSRAGAELLTQVTLSMTNHRHLGNEREAVRSLIGRGLAGHTWNAYAGETKRFVEFCNERNLQAFPAATNTVARYIAHHHERPDRIQASTLEGYLSAINTVHRLLELPPPGPDSSLLQLLRRGYHISTLKDPRRLERALLPATGVAAATRRAIRLASLRLIDGNQLLQLRDATATALAFTTFLRGSSLATMRRRDVEIAANVVVITITFVKRRQTELHRLRLPRSCPAADLLLCYMGHTKYRPPDSFLFHLAHEQVTAFNNGSSKPILEMVRRAMNDVGTHPAPGFFYGSHSPRLGGSSHAFAIGIPLLRIRDQGLWTDINTVANYINTTIPPCTHARWLLGWMASPV